MLLAALTWWWWWCSEPYRTLLPERGVTLSTVAIDKTMRLRAGGLCWGCIREQDSALASKKSLFPEGFFHLIETLSTSPIKASL